MYCKFIQKKLFLIELSIFTISNGVVENWVWMTVAKPNYKKQTFYIPFILCTGGHCQLVLISVLLFTETFLKRFPTV